MKSLYCFALIFALCVSDGLAFGFLFKRNVETEPPIAPVSGAPNAEATDVPQQVTPKEVKNWFVGVDDVFRTMTNDFAKRAQQRLAQLEHSVFGSIQEEVSQFQPVISGMQNKTAKEIRIVDGKIIETEEKVVSTGNKDEGTIAIYKIIKFRPQNPSAPSTVSPVENAASSQSPQNSQPRSSNEAVSGSVDQTAEKSQLKEEAHSRSKRFNVKVDVPIKPNGDIEPQDIGFRFSN